MNSRDVRFVDHGSPTYWQAVELRRAVLREPLGLTFSDQELDAEDDQYHLVLLDGGKVLGCLSLFMVNPYKLKMRQVAVRSDCQGQGIGKALVRFSEDWGRENGSREMFLHARDTAVPFYLSLGYEVVGEGFQEVSIPHRAMQKTL